jgi:hypothetical protein
MVAICYINFGVSFVYPNIVSFQAMQTTTFIKEGDE